MIFDTPLDEKILRRIQGHGLVLYDGDCGFCQFWIQFILKRDPQARFVFAPLQSPWAVSLGIQPKGNFDSVVLYENGILSKKSTAILKIFAQLKWPWKLAKGFLWVPAGFRDGVYDAIAKRRHQLAPRDACLNPSPEERRRFI